MKKVFCLTMLIIVSHSSFAQDDCTEAALQKKPGNWKDALKGSTSGVQAADLVREKNTVTALHAMIKSNYVAMGVRADFSGAYSPQFFSVQITGTQKTQSLRKLWLI
jgi:hypothetical protein